MHRTIQVITYPGEEGWYLAEAVQLPVVTQGRTYDETIVDRREALASHLEDESPHNGSPPARLSVKGRRQL